LNPIFSSLTWTDLEREKERKRASLGKRVGEQLGAFLRERERENGGEGEEGERVEGEG